MTGTAAPASELGAWAASGAMWLTGRPDEPPLGPPAGLVTKLRRIAAALGDLPSEDGSAIDPLALLAQRAAHAGLARRGDTSCGGATRLLPTGAGWLAVSLSRPSDVELVPAWLGLREPPADAWATVREVVRAVDPGALVERARLLGLPAATLPTAAVPVVLAPPPLPPLPLRAERMTADAAPRRHLDDVLVVDLTSLWAGPLCGGLLARAGARVLKVESTGRPDGGRHGPPAFFDALNGQKASVVLDLGAPEGARQLRQLLERADVVIEGSRPRALEQLGIEAVALLEAGGPQVWVSITGYGRTEPGRGWVAFGDDAAVAGGLVCWDDRGPCFCADAVADPTTGLVAAVAAVHALRAGGRWLLDVSMAAVAAHLAGPTVPTAGVTVDPRPPQPGSTPRRSPSLGADTAAILAELAIA